MSDESYLSELTHVDAPWDRVHVLVTGLGVSGFAAAQALLRRGARVTVVDKGTTQPVLTQRAATLARSGAEVRIGPDHVRQWPTGLGHPIDVVLASPGWPPHSPLMILASQHGAPIWGDVELAWRMRPRTGGAPWLCVTGTNGKTTTVLLLQSMLRAAGLRAVAVGNVGMPIINAVLDPEPYDMLAVELSSFQLHYAHSLSPLASAVLNLAPDHLDWHGSHEAYASAKASIYERTQVACVYNLQDSATETMVAHAEVMPGCRAIGFTVGVPDRSMLGLVEDLLIDRAFLETRADAALELATLADIAPDPGAPPAPHMVSNVLAAAALARAAGVCAEAVRDGVRLFTPAEHRMTDLGLIAGVRFVNDSKATNPHAAVASLAGYTDVVWIAGGQLKGADVQEVVAAVAPRLRGAVLLGADRLEIATALARHAPQVRTQQVETPETEGMDREQREQAMDEVMDEAVARAVSLASPGYVVLLAPAAASLDMFDSYEARGRSFTRAVRRLREGVAS
ncbi:MAG: UDP-N-acetylmuramoyl-L-alanine--D-glutamate ligase [Ornithinimicrobium sp.]